MNRLNKRGSGQVTGLKETQKKLLKGAVAVLYIADDADQALTGPVAQQAAEQGVEIVRVPTMKELGRAAGIEVGAAVAAILKEGERHADH